MKTTEGPDDTPGIDMASMMDCIFLLIIFFLVAATIRKKHQELPTLLPDAISHVKVEQASDAVILTVFPGEGDSVRVAVSTRSEMAANAAAAATAVAAGQAAPAGPSAVSLDVAMGKVSSLATSPETPIVIRAQSGLPYGRVAEVMGLLTANDYRVVDLDYFGR